MGHAPGGQKEKGVEWIFSCFFLSTIPVRVRNLLIATIKDGCSLNCFVGLTSSFFPFPLHVFFYFVSALLSAKFDTFAAQ